MKNQFIQAHDVHVLSSNGDSSMKEESDAETEPILAGESQEEDTQTIEDYWDSLKEIMLNKIQKGKGKQK